MSKADLEQIKQWIEAGADLEKGLRLFIKLFSRTQFGRIVRACPHENKTLAISKLLNAAGIENERIVVLSKAKVSNLKLQSLNQQRQLLPLAALPTEKPVPVFRDMFPFLNEPNTPSELKILAADKITAYRKMVENHRKLFDCTTIEQCYLTAKATVENYLENAEITKEFDHYKDTGKILGKHKIFDSYKELQAIRAKSAKDIFRHKKQIESCILQIKYQIKRGDKPHKLTEREKSLRHYQHLLDQINLIIEGI